MIDDTILAGRIPRLGTITAGRGVGAISRQGRPYARPTRSDTLVVHTDDGETANAVQVAFGGSILGDSPTWQFDVVTARREMPVTILPAGFRQSLQLWRAAQCVRRCDGVTMTTLDGKPTDRPCLCEDEMAQGADRRCDPSTVLPCLLQLGIDRFGVWEIRSNGWGTAAALKGAIRILTLAGSTSSSVPAFLSMADRTVRDTAGDVHEITELSLMIAQSHAALAAGIDTAALPDPELSVDGARRALLDEWSTVQQRAHAAEMTGQLRDLFRRRHPNVRRVEDLDDDHLIDWVQDATIALGDIHPAGDPKPPETDVPDLPGRVASEDRPGA